MTIVEKIKALMAKAASTDNPHEAELFLAKAHELMEKHQLEAHDLETDDPVNGEKYYEKGNIKAAPDWDFMLIFPVARYFGCKAIRIEGTRKWYMDLVGRESARVTAKEMHSYLVATVRRLGREAAANREFKLYKKDYFGDMRWTGEYLNADQASRRIGNALRERISILASAEEAKARASSAATAAEATIGKNVLITLDRVVAVFNERHPDAEPIKGASFTNDRARTIAQGIGLTNQVGGSGTLRIK